MSTKDKGKAEEDRQIRPFNAVLQEIGKGSVHTRLSEQLADLTAAVTATGKKGTLALVVMVEPLSKNVDGTLKVSAKTQLKAPDTDEVPVSVFFADDDGNLTRNDPNQLQLPLRSVESKEAAV